MYRVFIFIMRLNCNVRCLWVRPVLKHLWLHLTLFHVVFYGLKFPLILSGSWYYDSRKEDAMTENDNQTTETIVFDGKADEK